jgi:hypothetical protein
LSVFSPCRPCALVAGRLALVGFSGSVEALAEAARDAPRSSVPPLDLDLDRLPGWRLRNASRTDSTSGIATASSTRSRRDLDAGLLGRRAGNDLGDRRPLLLVDITPR